MRYGIQGLCSAAVCLTLTVGCGGGATPASVPGPADGEAGALPEGHPVMEASSLSSMEASAQPTTGVVQETLSGGGYTYARVSVGEREMWVAGPEAPLEVGQEIGIAGAMPMGNFSSPSLERTFENLYFVTGGAANELDSNAQYDRNSPYMLGGQLTDHYMTVEINGNSCTVQALYANNTVVQGNQSYTIILGCNKISLARIIRTIIQKLMTC